MTKAEGGRIMAGSLDHVMAGWSLIENMGDAYEAVEEMLYVILRCVPDAPRIINDFRGMHRGDLEPDEAYKWTIETMNR